MMGLNHADVALMMQGLEAPGNAIAQNRQEADKRLQLQIENDVRQRQLDMETRRMKSEEDRNDLLGKQQGENADQNVLKDMIMVNPFLTDEARESANGYLTKHPKWGAVGIQLAKPPAPPQKTQNAAVAQLEMARQYRDKAATAEDGDLKDWYLKSAGDLESAARVGGLPKNPASNYGPVQADKAASDLEDKRDEILGQAKMLESAASTRGPGPTGDDIYGRIESLKAQADKFDQRAKFLRQPKTDPTQLQTVTTTETDPDDVNRKTTVSSKVPLGQKAAVSAPSSAATPGAPKPGTVKKGYRFKGGDPSKKENWEKVQ